MAIVRTARAGSAIEDYCRACKSDRMHTVIAADANGQPLRVQCGYCRSEHNYRGGPRIAPSGSATPAVPAAQPVSPAAPRPRQPVTDALPIVSERERSSPPIMAAQDSTSDLELMLRRVIREEAGVTAVRPAEKWR